MGYDRFCKTYAAHTMVTGAASLVGHKAGRTVEVDWSGPTMHLVDPITGESSRVYLFVACLPFSRFAFVEPALDMRQDTWLLANVAMFEWFGGTVPRIVPDNLKTGVIKHPREGEIVLNDAYREMAAYYSAAVLPGSSEMLGSRWPPAVGHVNSVPLMKSACGYANCGCSGNTRYERSKLSWKAEERCRNIRCR